MTIKEAVEKLNFHHAAYTYLDEYLWIDRPLYERLSNALHNRSETDESKNEGLAAISRFLTYYSVARNFKLEEEGLRYEEVWNTLSAIEAPSPDQVFKTAHDMSQKLKQTYGNEPLSAVTKLLWLRFRTPIVIYDNLNWKWLHVNAGLKNNAGYAEFLVKWHEAYEYAEQRVAAATCDLSKVIEFTRWPAASIDDLEKVTQERWFHERVLDHAMVNAQSQSDLQASLY